MIFCLKQSPNCNLLRINKILNQKPTVYTKTASYTPKIAVVGCTAWLLSAPMIGQPMPHPWTYARLLWLTPHVNIHWRTRPVWHATFGEMCKQRKISVQFAVLRKCPTGIPIGAKKCMRIGSGYCRTHLPSETRNSIMSWDSDFLKRHLHLLASTSVIWSSP